MTGKGRAKTGKEPSKDWEGCKEGRRATTGKASSAAFPVFAQRLPTLCSTPSRSLLDVFPVFSRGFLGHCSTPSRSIVSHAFPLNAFPVFARRLPGLFDAPGPLPSGPSSAPSRSFPAAFPVFARRLGLPGAGGLRGKTGKVCRAMTGQERAGRRRATGRAKTGKASSNDREDVEQ